jgi:hypothetical protein
MANILNKAYSVRGKRGHVVFRRRGDGTFRSVFKPGDSVRVPSTDQLDVRAAFTAASKYASTAGDDPASVAFYQGVAKADKLGNMHAAAMRDYLRPPVIGEIDLSGYGRHVGDPILVDATDDAEVVSVTVRLRGGDGAELEAGAATRLDERWRYVATTEVPPGPPVTLEVIARDRPQHEGVKSLVVPGTFPMVGAIVDSGYHGAIGDTIVVSASDDVAVTAVNVRLKSATGAELEAGAAVPVDGAWRYLATSAIPLGTTLVIEATASDAAANHTTKTLGVVVA